MPCSLAPVPFANLNGVHRPNDMPEHSILGASAPRELSDGMPDTVGIRHSGIGVPAGFLLGSVTYLPLSISHFRFYVLPHIKLRDFSARIQLTFN